MDLLNSPTDFIEIVALPSETARDMALTSGQLKLNLGKRHLLHSELTEKGELPQALEWISDRQRK